MKILAAAFAASIAVPAAAQEAGECLPIKRADAQLEQSGGLVVGNIPTPGGMRFLVERADGTFKEMFFDVLTGQVCHVKDFIADPRSPQSSI